MERRGLLGGLAAGVALAGSAWAQERAERPGGPPAPRPERLPAAKTTQHTLVVGGRTLRFAATAGSVTLTDGQGVAQAEVAYVAYVLEGGEAARRPVTFAVNGGPGASSAWLHLGAMGPWRLELGGMAPSMPAQVVDNAETWLDFTDLVFIDPVGTGYSRFLATGEELRKRVWSVGGDIDSIAGAIRRWLVQAGRMGSPKYLAGESYGGFRGPRLARTLAQSHGVGLSGLVLVSPVLDFGGRSQAMDPLHFVTTLPTLVAGARRAMRREDVADAEAYAVGEYLRDLLRGADPDAVARRSERVAALTGLDPALVRRYGGTLDASVVRRNLPDGRIASLYDLDVTMADPEPHAYFSRGLDPVLDGLRAPMAAAMVALYGGRLAWRVEAPYELLNEAVSRGWDWGGGRVAAESLGALRAALALDPGLRVLVAHGLYDVVTPYFRTALQLEQVAPGAGRERVSLHAWPGGHMFYSRTEGRAALRREAATLYG
jgi:carboxypeptidase C (cathepsin A)